MSEFPESETGVLRRSFDAVIADPPYLNEDCMAKTGETIRILAKVRLTLAHIASSTWLQNGRRSSTCVRYLTDC